MIRRRRESRDRRVVTASITEEGLYLLSRLDKPVRDLHRNCFAHIPEKDLKVLQKLLERVRNSGK
ncbi:MAG: MarR family transcriptional regulator, partial [Acidobacteria bacterium]|nr:MarR family transcriptional regulator [Acidobacteriota bacterium]